MAQIPHPTMSSDRLLILGEYHIAACAQTPETAAIGTAFQPVQDELKTRKATREAAELAMVRPRVLVRFAEHRLEQAIRAAVFAAQGVDGTTDGGPAKTALVPDGLNAVVRPRGNAQKVTAEAFYRRLTTQPAAAPLVATHGPSISAALTAFQDAVSARALAANQLAEARAEEDAARESWVSGYAGDVGAVQAIFKKRRAERELYFDRFRASSSGAEDTDDGGEDDDEGGPSPAS